MSLFKGLLKPKRILAVFVFVIIFWQITPVKITKAADTIIDAKFLDVDINGTVDRIRWNMDESVTGCVYDAGDWTVNEIGGLSVTITGAACGTGVDGRDATDLDILVTADEHETSSTTLPQISYSNIDLDNSVMLAGAMGAHSNIDATDGAAPQIYAIGYLDLYVNNGKISWLSVLFSETIDDANSFLSANDLTITNPGSFTGLQFSTATSDMLSHGGMSGYTFGVNESSVLTTRETTGNFAMSTRNNFYLQDPAGNVNSTLGSLTFDLIDGTSPVIKTFAYKDADSDGKIDGGTLVFSETVDFSESELSARDIVVTAGDFTGLVAGDVTTDLLANGGADSDTVDITFGTEATIVSTNNSSTFAIATDSDEVFELVDLASPANTNDSSLGTGITYLDAAVPVVVSVSPTSGSSGVSRLADLVITFSEPMDTTFDGGSEFTVSPDPGVFTKAWTSSNKVVTLSHTSMFNSQLITVTTDNTVIDAASGSLTTLSILGPDDGDWTFTTASSGRGSSNTGTGGGSTSTTPTVTLTAPADDADLTGGDTQAITWTTSGSGLDTVGIYYSVDNGVSYNQIAYNLLYNLGTYDWTIPNIDSETLLVKIMLYDSGKAVLDTDVSIVFSITTNLEEVEEICGAENCVDDEEEDLVDIAVPDEEGRMVAIDSGLTGPSPVTGQEENISLVLSGQFIRSFSFDTIYFVDENNLRHPFWNTNVFFTYADSWDEVVWVTDATLPTMELGDPMLPLGLTVLVKIQSEPKVYAQEFFSFLRLIPDESTAEFLYGDNWSDYVIDLEPTVFSHFTLGEEMTTDDWVFPEFMKTRAELAELAQ